MSSPQIPPPHLSPDNMRELGEARQSLRKITRAASTAKIEGGTIFVFGILTFLCGIGSITDMLGGVILTVIGFVEFTSAKKLTRLDEKAIKILTINQLCLAGVILLYAVFKIYGELTSPSQNLPDLSQADAQVAGNLAGVQSQLTHLIYLAVYAGLIIAAFGEAALALYYHTRAAHLRKYLADTPAWIITMQKSGIAI
jgi:hypothetical protein